MEFIDIHLSSSIIPYHHLIAKFIRTYLNMELVMPIVTNLNIHSPLQESLLNEKQAAAYLNLTPRALQMWRHKGDGPKYVRISKRAVRYRMEDLIAFVNSKIKGSTSEY